MRWDSCHVQTCYPQNQIGVIGLTGMIQTGLTEITLADGREWKCMQVQISVQLLASLLHFIIASVSAFTVSAVQIQIMDRLNEGWSLHTMYVCTFCA